LTLLSDNARQLCLQGRMETVDQVATKANMDRAGRQPTVCQVVHSLDVGGAEILAADLSRQLRNDYRFVFVCLDALGKLGKQLDADGFSVFVVDRREGIDRRCMRKLAAIWRREGVRIVHAHQYTPFFYSLAAGFLRSRPPILFTEHGRWFPDFPNRKRIIFNRLMLRRRDKVVGVGNSVRRALIDNEGIRPSRVGVVYNGISIRNFAPTIHHSITRAEVRAEIGVADDEFVLLQVARLDALKDHITAIRTLQRVLRSCRNIRLVLVGEGPELPRIREEIQKRDLQSFVRLLGLRRDVARLMHAADVFLLTSVSEGIPLTAIEAMAAQLPVVATCVGGLPEVVEEGRTGLLAGAGSDEQLAACILRLAENRTLRLQMAKAGADRATARFSDERMGTEYSQLYQEMLSNGKPL
jgi:L-malate glycosyltransferase